MVENVFDVAAVLVALAALFGFLNHHFLRLPFTIGLTVSGLVASGAVLAVDALFPGLGLGATARAAVEEVDFETFLMHGVLGVLLFGGALHIDLEDLLSKKWQVFTLASVGVLISTAVVGLASWGIFRLLEVPVPLAYCFVFGAVVSPTDPVAVLGIMKSLGAPKGLEIKVSGESLFNDGVGVVVFTVLLAVARGTPGGESIGAGEIAVVFAREVAGGVLIGLLAGYVTYRAMKTFDEPNLEILLSVALVMGMSLIAFRLHSSAPLACVVAGLFIGNHGRRFAMTERTRTALDLVWSFIDLALNAVLFLLVGLEVVAITFGKKPLLGAVILVPVTLLARFVSVLLPVAVLRLRHEFSRGAVKVLTWGGLKGGISVALALSLPRFPGREAVLAATYAVVIFSIVVQGLTVGRLIRREAPSRT